MGVWWRAKFVLSYAGVVLGRFWAGMWGQNEAAGGVSARRVGVIVIVGARQKNSRLCRPAISPAGGLIQN